MLDWAANVNSSFIKAGITKFFHSSQSRNKRALNGATVDDYRRIQLATFRISAVVRYKTTPAIQSDQVVKGYVGIANLLGKGMDTSESSLKDLIEQTHFVGRSSSDHSLHGTANAYDTEYKRLVINAAKKVK